MPTTYDSIATTTLTSSQSTITFSSIPQTYSDLRVVMVSTYSTAGNDSYYRFNSDGGSNYATTCLNGEGGTVETLRSNSTFIYWSLWQSYTSSTLPMLLTADIFGYTGSTFKHALNTSSSSFGTNGNVSTTVGVWRNTAAVTSITMLQGGGDFVAGTTATLYGILRA
jgi:hypothetical protein